MRFFQGHLRDLVERSMNAGYATRWAQHYSTLTGEDFVSSISYITSRAAYCLSTLSEYMSTQAAQARSNDSFSCRVGK